jgi:hypothetical protein
MRIYLQENLPVTRPNADKKSLLVYHSRRSVSRLPLAPARASIVAQRSLVRLDER